MLQLVAVFPAAESSFLAAFRRGCRPLCAPGSHLMYGGAAYFSLNICNVMRLCVFCLSWHIFTRVCVCVGGSCALC